MVTGFTQRELDMAEEAIRTRSFLLPETQLTEQRIDNLINTTVLMTVATARRELGNIELIVRAGVPSDMPDLSNNDWTETTSASNSWTNTAFAAGGSIADNTFLGIYGVHILTLEDAAGVTGWGSAQTAPPVTAMRTTIGGSRVAQWDLNTLLRAVAQAGTAATAYGPLTVYPAGYVESPVIVTQNKDLTIAFWETASGVDFQIQPLFITVEPPGQGAGLNP